MDNLESAIASASDVLWTWMVLPVVVCLGLYFTVRLLGLQVRAFPQMISTLREPVPLDAIGEPQSITSFQAFTVSAASRVGVGNIAGVGTAIVLGGPGAIFWMWLMALVGGASSFVESTLGQLYKVRDDEGFRGGPAYYMQHGIGSRAMGMAFAIVLIVCFPFAFSSLQANTIAATVDGISEGQPGWVPWVIGLALAGLTALVIFGGLHRIAEVTDKVVPLMALAYLLLGLAIVAINVDQVPWAVSSIVTDAFTMNSATGAAVGSVILAGVKRGMFSNEAGLGSAPNAGSSAAVTHPVKQGLVQTLGVYFDTMIICSITAFIILVSQPDLANAEEGIGLTQGALVSGLGEWTEIALAIIIFLLAFSSIIGNYYYGQANIEFITTSPVALTTFRTLAVVAVFAGAVASASLIWTFADGIMGLMALINLVAIAILFPVAKRLWDDYSAQRKAGDDPVYVQSQVPVRGYVEYWQDAEEVVGSRRPRA